MHDMVGANGLIAIDADGKNFKTLTDQEAERDHARASTARGREARERAPKPESPAQNAARVRAPEPMFPGDMDASVKVNQSRFMDSQLMLAKADAFLRASMGM